MLANLSQHLRWMRDFPRQTGHRSALCFQILLPASVAAAVSALVSCLLFSLQQNPFPRISSSDKFLISRVSDSSAPARHSHKSPVNPPESSPQSLPKSLVMAPYNGKFAGELVVVGFWCQSESSCVAIGLLVDVMCA